jgi:hypothetical protein
MNRFIEISVPKDKIIETINHYEELGFLYIKEYRTSKQEITLVFEGSIELVGSYSDSSTRAYIEFGDKTISPLYIKRVKDD